MSEVLQTNIFFIITTIAVIVVTVLLAIGLYHAIRILRAIRRIAERMEAGSKQIAEDAAHFRSEFLSGNLISSLFSRFMPQSSRKKRAHKREAKEESAEDIRGEEDMSQSG